MYSDAVGLTPVTEVGNDEHRIDTISNSIYLELRKIENRIDTLYDDKEENFMLLGKDLGTNEIEDNIQS